MRHLRARWKFAQNLSEMGEKAPSARRATGCSPTTCRGKTGEKGLTPPAPRPCAGPQKGRFGESTDGGGLITRAGSHSSNTLPRVAFAAQLASFGEFGSGTLIVAIERICGGEGASHTVPRRKGTFSFFEPKDRVVDIRLEQMGFANPKIPIAEQRIARAEPNGLLQERNSLLNRPDVDLASADIGNPGSRT